MAERGIVLKKAKYESPVLEIEVLDMQDVILSSGVSVDDEIWDTEE